MQSSYGGSEVDQSTLQLVIDQIEELVVTIIEEVRQRPSVALAILAGVLGAFVGTLLASGIGRPKPAPERVARRVNRVGDMAAMAGMGMRLLENPLVRSYALAMLSGQLRKRLRL